MRRWVWFWRVRRSPGACTPASSPHQRHPYHMTTLVTQNAILILPTPVCAWALLNRASLLSRPDVSLQTAAGKPSKRAVRPGRLLLAPQWLLGLCAQLWRSFHLFGNPPLGTTAGVVVGLMIYRRSEGAAQNMLPGSSVVHMISDTTLYRNVSIPTF